MSQIESQWKAQSKLGLAAENEQDTMRAVSDSPLVPQRFPKKILEIKSHSTACVRMYVCIS